MFRSLSRITVATALVLAFLLSTVPVQAQPRDLGSSFSLDTSWLDAALIWLDGLLGGGSEGVQTMTTGGKKDDGSGGNGGVTIMGGPCIDPFGCPG
jgi:hypothetical protein